MSGYAKTEKSNPVSNSQPAFDVEVGEQRVGPFDRGPQVFADFTGRRRQVGERVHFPHDQRSRRVVAEVERRYVELERTAGGVEQLLMLERVVDERKLL